MAEKTYLPEGEGLPASQIGATLEALACTIAARRHADGQSYTHRLLSGPADDVLKKVMEEAGEVALAGKDADALMRMRDAHAAAGGSHGAASAEAAQRMGERMVSDAVDHLRYEAADVVYHLLVVLERYGIGIDEFAAELNNRMTDAERPEGAVRLRDEFVKRGK